MIRDHTLRKLAIRVIWYSLNKGVSDLLIAVECNPHGVRGFVYKTREHVNLESRRLKLAYNDEDQHFQLNNLESMSFPIDCDQQALRDESSHRLQVC